MQTINTGSNPYVLPEGKEYHIFIACSGEDSEKGRWLMEQLESRYPFRCVYHERDFQPGVMIVENMRDYIDKSVKSLLLISNGFNQSYHCRLEETFAISVSNETGHNCIIPVLLEDVPLPSVLRHMTYIDWRPHIQGDVVAQIREGYCRTAYQIGLSSNLNQIGGDDNGKRIGFIEGNHSSSCFGCRLKFEDINITYDDFDQETRQHIEEMCFDTTQTLNSKSVMMCYGFFTLRRELIGMFLFSVIYCIVAFGIYGIFVAANEKKFDVSVIWTPIWAGILAAFFVYFFLMGCIGSWISSKYIETTMWEIFKRNYKQSKCFIFYDNLPIGILKFFGFSTLRRILVIRYDTQPCKEFVLLYLRNKFPEFSHVDGGYEEWADKLIECTIAYYSHDIIHWEDLQKSSYNRHGIWKQRECICQLVEPHLSELSLGQCVWFTNLGKREHKTFSNGTVTYGRTIIL